ncbi:hypothetical protein [Cyanobium sp. NIES-981]|uniref:hypothetical protein n=1 Tax=Cyanobium sp. NIES-981 TaxID=1851505 RepID=UPI0007DDF980|nr:hypothetical protein [Cyanobium sp. NIES-981]SBO42162.1 conserved protein of unknown function [Cyanobium sp. NIES-981]
MNWRRMPLRVTAATTLLLLLGPAVALWRLPRPRAEGLGRLLAQAALLQSFPAAPGRPVPRLWQERLGEAPAARLWSQQRRLWWQFWGSQGDGPAYLVLPMPRALLTGALAMPPHSAVVDDLLVVAADPLSHRLLTDQLKRQPRQHRGLEQRCLARLEQEQAAFWTPGAFGVMAGPVAPLLQSFQEGCLSLELSGGSLAARGEAAAVTGLLAAAPAPVSQAVAGSVRGEAPQAGDSLLLLEGRSLDVLLQGLLGRQLIRDPLATRYGAGPAELARLRRTPFRLMLRPMPSGPFQASLLVQLAPGADRRVWAELLTNLRERLAQEGLSDAAPPSALPAGTATLPASLWRREDGVVVGGWRWLSRPGAAPELVLFLGPEPKAIPGSPVASGPQAPLLRLELQPRALTDLGLMPPSLPSPLRQAARLAVVAERPAGEASPISALWARLQLQTTGVEPSPPPAPTPPSAQPSTPPARR